MKRIKMILVAMMAVAAFGVVGASSASAGQVNLTLSGDAAGQTIDECDAVLTTSGTPPSNVTITGSTFAGDPSGPSNNPCDPASLRINNNPVVSFSGSYNAQINTISVTDLASTPSCTFTASGTNLSAPALMGPYSGTDTAPGSGSFLCLFVTANINVDNAVFS